MKLTNLVAAAAVIFGSVANTFAQTADPLVLSLDECLAIALSDNPTVKVADLEIQRVDYSKIETLSQLLPQVSFAGNILVPLPSRPCI